MGVSLLPNHENSCGDRSFKNAYFLRPVHRTVDSNTHREAEKNNMKIGPVNITT
jgi:hypothetical protein